jgi:hypothetical protein
VILKLNNYAGQTILLSGNVPAGSQLLLSGLQSKNLFDAQYDASRGFRIFDVAGSMFSTTRTSHTDITCSKGAWGYIDTYVSTYSFSPQLPVSNQWNISYGSGSGITSAPTATVTSSKMVQISQGGQTFVPSAWCSGWATAYYYSPASVTVWDMDPIQWIDYAIKFSSGFQSSYAFTGQQMYLVAKPNGGTITIKGAPIDPSTIFLKITNLPPNIPYEIVKEGKVAASGMSDSGGAVSITAGQTGIGGTSPSGTMYVYPNSRTYRGPFSPWSLTTSTARQSTSIPRKTRCT